MTLAPRYDSCPKCGASKLIGSRNCRGCYVRALDVDGLSAHDRIVAIRGDLADAQASLSVIDCLYPENPYGALRDASQVVDSLTAARLNAQRLYCHLVRAGREAKIKEAKGAR